MSKQTAVEWFIEQLKKPYSDKYIMDIIERAKAMEKQQIIDAVDGFPLANRNLEGTDYYNKTYGG